jgi:hypothetical protein
MVRLELMMSSTSSALSSADVGSAADNHSTRNDAVVNTAPPLPDVQLRQMKRETDEQYAARRVAVAHALTVDIGTPEAANLQPRVGESPLHKLARTLRDVVVGDAFASTDDVRASVHLATPTRVFLPPLAAPPFRYLERVASNVTATRKWMHLYLLRREWALLLEGLRYHPFVTIVGKYEDADIRICLMGHHECSTLAFDTPLRPRHAPLKDVLLYFGDEPSVGDCDRSFLFTTRIYLTPLSAVCATHFTFQ